MKTYKIIQLLTGESCLVYGELKQIEIHGILRYVIYFDNQIIWHEGKNISFEEVYNPYLN